MFGGGWLRRLQNGFDGDPATQVFGGRTQQSPLAPPAASAPSAAPADPGFRLQREADSAAEQIKRPAGWWPKLAQVFAVTGDVGRGLEGNTPAYAPALRQRWAAAAKAKATQGQNASTAEILRNALAKVPEADRAGLEALIRNAPDTDTAMRIYADYEQETRGRRNKREDVEWERNLPPEGMVEDPVTKELRPRAGWPVPNMPGRVYGMKGEIVAQAGFAATPEGQKALAEVDYIKANTQAAWANVRQSDAEADYIRSGKGKDGANAEGVSKLRGEYVKQSERTTSIANNYAQIQAVANDQSGTSDIALVYSYMKMLDPGSTVMQGEYATAENAGGVHAKYLNTYNKLLRGERLDRKLRESFAASARTIYQAQAQRQDQLDKYYSDLALQSGIDPRLVIVPRRDFGAPPPGPPAPGKPGTGNGTINRLSQGGGGYDPSNPLGLVIR